MAQPRGNGVQCGARQPASRAATSCHSCKVQAKEQRLHLMGQNRVTVLFHTLKCPHLSAPSSAASGPYVLSSQALTANPCCELSAAYTVRIHRMKPIRVRGVISFQTSLPGQGEFGTRLSQTQVNFSHRLLHRRRHKCPFHTRSSLSPIPSTLLHRSPHLGTPIAVGSRPVKSPARARSLPADGGKERQHRRRRRRRRQDDCGESCIIITRIYSLIICMFEIWTLVST